MTRSRFAPQLAASLLASAFVTTFIPATAHGERLLLAPTVVVASRHVQAVAQTPASVTVLDEKDLANETTQALENILASRAGVTIARSGGPGQQTSIFMRGNNSTDMLVLIDGIKVNDATFGGANLQNLRGADIARIEIVRGPRSTLYGSEAIGGVISITTRRAASRSEGDATAVTLRGETGSDGSHDLRAAASRKVGDTQLAVHAGRYATDGDIVVGTAPVTGAHDNTSGGINAATRLGDTRVGIDALTASGTTQYVDTFSSLALHQDFRNSVARLWSESSLGDNLLLRTRIGMASDDIDQQESADYAHTRRISGSIEGEARLGSHTLLAGIDAEHEKADALVFGTATHDATDNLSVFLRDQWRIGKHDISVAARETDHDSFGRKTTGEASYGLHINNHTFAWLSAGRGFRAPNATERYGYGGNPALKPESSLGYEAGIRQRLGANEVSITGFRQDVDDLFVCVALPPPSFDCVLQNIDSARITGTELGWNWQHESTRADAFITLQDPIDNGTGSRLSRRPEKQLSASVRQQVGVLEYHASLLAMDSRDNSAFDAKQLPGFAVFNLGVTWTARQGLAIDARVENVGDKRYTLASSGIGDYHMPDRAFFVGVEWQPPVNTAK